MPVSPLRVALALAVLGLLGRAGRVAWSRRDLAVAVWRGIRPRHVAGSLGLLVVVVATSLTAAVLVPALGLGLGDLFATSGNAVFAPVEVAADVAATSPDPATGELVLRLASSVFLAVLALLLPWFAFVEEELFRAGAETWSLPRRIVAALVFGAAHLVMLVPFAAALGISVAGFVYGEIYRRGTRAPASPAPAPVRAAFRSTPRSRAARAALVASGADPFVVERRQVDGVYSSTVWHTTFNTTVVGLLWLSFVVSAA